MKEKARLLLLSTVILAVAAVGLTWISKLSLSKEVVYVVPNEFRGEFRIVVDPKSSFKPKIVNNVMILFIPADGRLVVSDAGILHDWHKDIAYFSDGKGLEYRESEPLRSPVGLHFLLTFAPGIQVHESGTEDQVALEELVYWVGNEEEARNHRMVIKPNERKYK